MSRIGKKTIAVPKGVTVTLDGQTVTVKGPKGERSWTVADEIEVKQDEDGWYYQTLRSRRSPGLYGVDTSTGFELVDQGGTAKLYRITACD